MSIEGAIAAHRFGLGARPGEIDAASSHPRSWLEDQLDGPVEQPESGLPSGGSLMARLEDFRRQRAAQKNPALAMAEHKENRQIYMRDMSARFILGFTTDRPFAERLVWFWSNHLNVSTVGAATAFIGAYEREAIRPHVLGKFEDMVLASARHPAMLLYLNNAESIGPNSRAAARSGKGLNENYGRELMELHTLGVDGGYTQTDVIVLAKILTGWGLDRFGDSGTGFRFYPNAHEPGTFTLMGKSYPEGENGGIQAIRDLANHPKTARHVAKKFAGYFIAENPSQASVDKLTAVFTDTHGDLRALALAAVADPEAWRPGNTRMRSPVEYVTATARALNWPKGSIQSGSADDKRLRRMMQGCRTMGEFPFSAPSPKGFDDASQMWANPDAILARLEWASATASAVPKLDDPVKTADSALGPLLAADTKFAIQRSASAAQGLALVLASPEFQLR